MHASAARKHQLLHPLVYASIAVLETILHLLHVWYIWEKKYSFHAIEPEECSMAVDPAQLSSALMNRA
jgi:hypothetical protein